MMTQEILVELWKIEDIPACDDGMVLAHEFLKSCVSALTSGNPANFHARFENYMRHSICVKNVRSFEEIVLLITINSATRYKGLFLRSVAVRWSTTVC